MDSNTTKSSGSCKISRRRCLYTDVDTDLLNSPKTKDKPLIKKQLSIWNIFDLKKIIDDINNTELLCKKNPQISNSIFFNFFSAICKKANNFS